MRRQWWWAIFVVVAASAPAGPSLAASPAPPLAAAAAVAPPGGGAAGQAVDEASARAAARRTGHPVEVTSRSTETARLFANPSGTMTLEDHAQPVQVARGGRWVPVDTRLRTEPGGTLAPAATITDLALSGGGDGPVARLGHQGHELALAWPARLPAPLLAGDTATYPGVLPGVDLELRATATGLDELLLLETRQAAANPALARIRFTTATKGLALAASAGGGLSARDAAGAVVFSAEAPAMWETAGPDDIQPRQAPVRLQVSGGELTLLPDERMLADPTMRFPLTIDPFVNFGLRQWGNVTANAPNQGIATDPFRSEGAKAGHGCDAYGCYTYRSLFAFTGLPYGTHVLGATFGATLYHSWSCQDTPVELWLTGGINDGSSWNNTAWIRWLDTRSAHAYSGCGGPVRMLFGNGLAGAVQDGVNARWPDITVGLKAPDENNVYQWKRFYTDVSLSVEYNSFPNQPSALNTQGKGCTIGAGRPWLATTTPQVTAFVSDPDAGQTLNATVEFWYTGGARITNAVQNNLGNGSWVVVNAPAGALADGGTYSWRVAVNDGIDWSSWSGWCEFSVDATPANPASGVTSTDYPNDGSMHGTVGQTGHFNLLPPAAQPDHVSGYLVGLNACAILSCARFVPASPTDHSGGVDLTPDRDFTNVLSVWTVNRAGLSDATHPFVYTFLVRPGLGPAGWWPMNDGAGTTAADAAGHGNTATLAGGATWTSGRSGVGSALALDGSTGYAATPGPVQARDPSTGSLVPVHTNQSFTVAAWVKPSTVSGSGWYPTAVSSDGSRASAFFLRYSWGGSSARWRFDVTQSDVDNAPLPGVAGTSPVLTDRWTFVAGTYDAATQTITLYVNGAVEGSVVISGTFDSGGPLVIGRGKWLGQLNHFLPGAVKDVRIWNRVVQASELQALARPLPPAITLPGGPVARVNQSVQVTLSAGGDANVTSYRYSLDDPSLATPSTATPSSPGGPVTVTVTPTTVDIHTIYAVAVDARGRTSDLAAQDVEVDDVPAAPTGVTATGGSGQATVSWTFPASDGGTAITGFTVTASPGGRTASVDGGSTVATVTGLSNGTAYTFTVTATNAAGTGPASAPSNPVTPLGPPGAPTGVAARAGNQQATVTWTAPGSTGGSPITGYTVTASPGGQTAAAGGSATSATVAGLTNGTAYTFTVTASNAAGTGPVSAASNAVTPTAPPTAPGAPTAVLAWAGDTQANVSWTPPASDGGSPITGYTVTGSPGGATVHVGAGVSSTTVTGLTDGVTYTFTVTATNAVGTSPASAASNAVTVAAVPGAPTGVTAVAGNGQATVSWTPPASNGGAPVTSYTVTASPGGQSATVAAPATSAVVSMLSNGTAYTFTVTASNSTGTGPASAASPAVTPQVPTVTPVFRQQATGDASSAGMGFIYTTFAGNVTAGSRIVVALAVAGGVAATVIDSASNSYTELASRMAPDGTELSVWSAPVTAGADTALTIAAGSSQYNAFVGLVALEYQGAGALDVTASAGGTTSAAGAISAGATAATAGANELAVGVGYAFGTLGYGAGWTGRAALSETSGGLAVEDQVVGQGATPNAGLTTDANEAWAMTAVVFRPAGS